MGYIHQSDHMVTEQTRIMSDILESQFTHFIQGQGNPVLTTWFSIDELRSTVAPGLETVDDLLGPESGLRFYRIDGVPVLGLNRDINPEVNVGDGNIIDYNLDIEVTTIPGTIHPKPFEYVYHRFGPNNERSILFRVGNVKVSSLKSNSFFKAELHAVDIDDNNNMYAQLMSQVSKTTFRVSLDRIGTQDGCIVESTVFDEIERINRIYTECISNYIDYYYDAKYNVILLRSIDGIGYPLYDPYLTKFLISTAMLADYKQPINLVDIDDIPGKTRAEYNLTFYRAVELRKKELVRESLKFAPIQFSNTVMTPFDYYGEETVFKVGIYDDPDTNVTTNSYMKYPLIDAILNEEESIFFDARERIIYRYFTKSDILDCVSNHDLDELENTTMGYNEYDIRTFPIMLYILREYQHSLGLKHTEL